MIKKIMALSVGFILVGLIGTAVTTPFAITDGINTYNEITETTKVITNELDIEDPVSSIKITFQNSQPTYNGWGYVTILNSSDEKIHITTQDAGFSRRHASVQYRDNTAIVQLEEVRNYQINKENINKAIATSLINVEWTVVYLPEHITLVSTEMDRCHFEVPEGVRFENADVIRKYGYYLTPEEIAEREAREREENRIQELESLLNAQSETINNLESQLANYQEQYGDMSFYAFSSVDTTDSWFVNDRIRQLQSRIQEYQLQYVNQEITLDEYNMVVENLYNSIDEERTYLANQLISNGTYSMPLGDIQPCILNILDQLEKIQGYSLANLTNQVRYKQGEITQNELDSLTNVINNQIKHLKIQIEVNCQTLEHGGFPTDGILDNINNFDILN